MILHPTTIHTYSPHTLVVVVSALSGSVTRLTAVQELVGRWGWVRGTYAATMTYLQRRFDLNFCRVTTRPLGNIPLPATRTTHCEYRSLSEAELIQFAADPELQLTPDLVRAALRRNDVCIGAVENNRLIAYTWIAFDATPHLDGLWVSFTQRARYAYKVFVRPEYRGSHIAGEMNVFGDKFALKRGRTIGIGFIDTHNFASYRASRRIGARTIGYAGYVRCFGRIVTFRSPGAKRYGFSFYRPQARAHS